ncbi:hypothetical protein CK203_110988 [Vitis vinifera]|uniref:Uncharacterized protein n=1 Tax=Vitis vinifera TaxID=29760 RepID=A0A438CE75_VITVI|nr:hypothetical protein CK203_110988 [Vitis vinifera]
MPLVILVRKIISTNFANDNHFVKIGVVGIAVNVIALKVGQLHMVMDLGNTHEALVHFLLIIGMTCLDHCNEFLMDSRLHAQGSKCDEQYNVVVDMSEYGWYFPIKAPIPGSSSSSARLNKPPSLPKSGNNICKRIGIRAAKLLQSRELHGDVIPSKKGKCNFEKEYLKVLASQPLVWKYQETDRIGDGALEQISTDINTSDGQSPKDLLLTGGVNGYLSLYEVAKVGHHFDYGVKCMPDRVWPPVIGKQTDCSKAVGHIWRPTGASLVMQSSISCIKMVGKHSPCTIDDQSAIQHVLYPFIISDIYDYVALLLDVIIVQN